MYTIINAIRTAASTEAKYTAKYAVLNGDFGLVDLKATNVLLDMTAMSRDEIFDSLKEMAIRTPWNRGGFQKWNRTAYVSEAVIDVLVPNYRGKNEITVYNDRDSISLSREEGDKVYRVEVWSR